MKGDLWDSGKVGSDDSVLVPYKGQPLESGMSAFWRVQVWDQAGAASPWSETAHWSMGLLHADDWKGKWIGLDETGVYKNPRSPFQSLKMARWIWSADDPGQQTVTRWFKSTVSIPAGRVVRHAGFVLGADSSFELKINGKYVGRGGSVVMPEVIDAAAALQPARMPSK